MRLCCSSALCAVGGRWLVNRQTQGFTLLEISIVLCIIALLSVAVLKGQSLIRGGEVTDLVATAGDLRNAASLFRQRFHYLPGDFPVDATNPEIAGISDACKMGNASAGNGNGLIESTESACATEELIRTDFLRWELTKPLRSRYGTINLLSMTAAGIGAFDTPVRNVILFANIPCDEAISVDIKLDDGNLGLGKIQASNAACQGTSPISLAVAL